MERKMTTEFHTGPVTALLNYKQFVIAGVGGSVFLYDTQKKTQVGLQCVLPCRKVHGIKREFSENVFCVYGEKCFRIISISTTDVISIDCMDEAVVLEDWILDITWLREPVSVSPSQLGVALAHNVIQLWDVSLRTLVHRVDCVEKCILYCAHFIGTSWTNLVLAAGAVFNQVILWSPGGATNSDGQKDVMHRLQGHQGVIFSIDYHPVMRVMASVSDDRTIRLWTLTFASDRRSVCDWEGVESCPPLTLYGHTARVWDIELLDNIFVSVGEDATCLVWDYSGKILHKFKGHKGKSIWSLACDRDEKFVVTGGGDTSIRVWSLEDVDGHQDTVHRSLSVPLDVKAKQDDFPRSIALPDTDTVLAMTNEGRLLKYTVSSATWTLIYHDPQFSSYTIMATSPDGRRVAIGNITGIIKVFDVDSCAECCSGHLYQDKVFGLVWLDTDHILTTGPQGDMYVLSVPSLTRTSCLTLPVCKQRWASAGVLCADQKVLVCGDRGGTVHCYDISHGCQDNPVLPVLSYGKIHGKAGVTDVCYYGNTVYTSGRDGQYRQWDIVERELKLSSSHKVMKGMDWIDRVCVDEADILIYGFLSSHFTLWSVGQNLRLMDIECGGGHRAWDCQLDGGRARFVYLKTKQIAICDTTCRSRQVILKGSLHGREMCDIKHLATFRTYPADIVHVLATCSEDTTVQLVSITSHNGISDLKVLHTLQGHLSTVKTLAVSSSRVQGNGNSVKSDIYISHKQVVCSSLNAASCTDSRDAGKVFSAADGAKNLSAKVEESDVDKSFQGEGQTAHQGGIIFSGGGRAQIQIWRVRLNNPLQTIAVKEGKERDSKGDKDADQSHQTESPKPPASSVGGNECERTPHNTSSANDSVKLCSTKSSELCSYEHLACVFLCGPRRETKSGAAGHPQSDPETRVMCLTALCLRNVDTDYPATLHVVAAACSDAYVRVFGFDENQNVLTLLQQSSYHDNCVLKVDHIIHRLHPSSKVILLSGATEGHLAFWDISEICQIYVHSIINSQPLHPDTVRVTNPESGLSVKDDSPSDEFRSRLNLKSDSGERSETDSRYRKSLKKNILRTLHAMSEVMFSPVRTVKAHQSGVNSLHCLHCGDGRYHVASGGDDNCLTVTTIRVQEDVGGGSRVDVQVEKCEKNVSAHAAQITGVWLLSAKCVVSVSIDQRVCVWDLTHTGFKMIGCRYVHFSDISNLDVWRDECDVYLYVCGEGLSVLHIDQN